MNNEHPPLKGRRSFLARATAIGAGALVANAALPDLLSALQDGKSEVLATLKLAEHKELEAVGGWKLIKDTPKGDVLIVRSAEKEITAMSNICPHKECKVKVKNEEMLQCPCHKSAYKLDGTYIHGPSKKSLTKFTLVEKDGIITITE